MPANPPTNTRVKIRYGLILQGVLARALTAQGYAYDETPAYDEDSEVPDFLIPNADEPEFAVEVHQTDARDHFRMKTLRSLTAVAEVKAYFGPDVVSVNVLFGDPDAELPEANLRAMCGIFDVNVLLQRDADGAGRSEIRGLEAAALELAKDTNVSTADAAEQLVASHGLGVAAIGELMNSSLENGTVNGTLTPMWEAEQERRNALGDAPAPGNATFYKKNMIRSLYFQDSDFDAMVEEVDPDAWPESAQQQVIRTKIGEVAEDIDGDHLEIDPEFAQFLRDPDTPHLRGLCKAVLDENEAMHWFFEDIRDSDRRKAMVGKFLSSLESRDSFDVDFIQNFETGISEDIVHTRCWFADLMPLCLRASHNQFNRLMVVHPDYSLRLGNPYNNITIRSGRLGQDQEKIDIFSSVALATFWEQLEMAANDEGPNMSAGELEDRLLQLRMTGAMRLRHLEPLSLMFRSIAKEIGLNLETQRIQSVLSDLGEEVAVGAFDFWSVSNGDISTVVLANAIAAEGNPRDKAKEWGARRFASLYRLPGGNLQNCSGQKAIFVIDGIWEQSDVTRLYRSGWDYVVRMGDLENALCEVFAIY